MLAVSPLRAARMSLALNLAENRIILLNNADTLNDEKPPVGRIIFMLKTACIQCSVLKSAILASIINAKLVGVCCG